ncbi:aspartyl-phosphate phosphatase Spo0E family protein [Bacillus sp. SA1-12]|uniref:aspartyl-phosphate phosphatase Spo0E family protein n=1 Tax=Bacillus sp. SA1-12 TaxID=1455638 RepID=UPI000A07D971|nr:aspartyl-phosphate phosphatase Spo0E family protein [Bacillus sp. SA1-12]
MPLKRFIIIFLEFEIFLLRYFMINTGKLKGLTHPQTIKFSQKLDNVLNKYQNIKFY